MAGRMVAGEHVAMMVARGQGIVYYGHRGLYLTIIDVGPAGPLTVEADRPASVVINDLGGSRDGSGAGTSMADDVVKEIKDGSVCLSKSADEAKRLWQ